MGEKETDYIDIQTWDRQAETCNNYIGKGSLVAIQGSLRVEKYEGKDGNIRKSTRVNADRVNFLSNNKPKGAVFEPAFEPSFVGNFEGMDDDCPF